MLEAGLKGYEKILVTEDKTAKKVGSGSLLVFATPMMVALMEKTSLKSIEEFLEDGETTVGTLVNVSHVSATPVGMEVTCESVLTEVDGRRLVFSVKAYDEAGLVGEGTHERFIVKSEKFQGKADSKKQGK